MQCPHCKQMTIVNNNNIFFDMEMVRKDKEEKVKLGKKGFLKRALENALIFPIGVLLQVLVWVHECVPEKLRGLFWAEVLNTIFFVSYLFHGNYYGIYYSSYNTEWFLIIPFILPLLAYLLSLLAYRFHQDSIRGIIEFCEILLWGIWLGTLMGIYGSEESYV